MNTHSNRFLASASTLLMLVFIFSGVGLPVPVAEPGPQAPVCTAGPHSGHITADQTWCTADNPHLLEEDDDPLNENPGEITVDPGVTLTLEPGVIVKGNYYTGIYILGHLSAIGTENQPIILSAQEGEQWRGIGFSGGASQGELKHVVVQLGGMYHSVVTSFAEVAALNVGIGGLTIEDSAIQSAFYDTSGHVYGISVNNSQFSMTGTTVSGMGNASDDGAMFISGDGTIANLDNNTFTGNWGTTLRVGSGTVVINHNEFFGNHLAMSVSGDNLLIENNYIHNNGGGVDPRGGIIITGGHPTILGNLIKDNNSSTGTLTIGSGNPLIENNAIIDNHAEFRCNAIYISASSDPVFKHNTIAGNTGGDGSAICMFGEGTHGQFFNTIIANETVGILTSFDSGNVEMYNTLWDKVPTLFNGVGPLINNTPFYGSAAFDLDGYHLTRKSAAIGKGSAQGVTTDIDGEARPLPIGTLPDLGADEYPAGLTPIFESDFYSEPPRLEVIASGGVQIRQEFFLFWFYGSEENNPPSLPITITNTLGNGMIFDSSEISGSGNFSVSQVGSTVTFQAQQSVEKNQFGFIRMKIHYEGANAQVGDVIDNTVHVVAGSNTYDKTVSTTIPDFPPKITWPLDGQACSGQFLNMVVTGYAMPGTLIYLYEDGVQKATGGANDENGLFTITYSSDQAGINNYVQITVKSCNLSNPYDCSLPSNTITVEKQTSFWCPSRSYWEGDFLTVHSGTNSHHLRFGFRDNQGKLATEGWAFSAGTGLINSTLSLHLCVCPGGTDYPSETWVMIGGTRYDPSGGSEHIPWFSIPAASGEVEFHAMCGGSEIINHGTILVDPDGFIFDVTQGFDESNPLQQHVVPGATVTLFVDEPSLGGWVQWPAQLYDNQVNPQITGSDGYYAFYTPPGHYYVQVTGPADFQPWRSPVITVVDQLVHLNVPLTPNITLPAKTINLTVTGPDQPVVTLNPGDALAWTAEVIPNISDTARKQYTLNPVIHPLSDLNPQNDILGWDSGMLIPGQVYTRQFSQPGIYTYDDGLGNIGQVLVGISQIFLPMVQR